MRYLIYSLFFLLNLKTLKDSTPLNRCRLRFVLQDIASVYTGLMQGVGAAEKVFEYLDKEPSHPADGTEAPDTCTGLVEFKDVTFAYPTRPDTDILKVCSEGSCCHNVLINST